MNENLLDVLLYLFEHYPLGEVQDDSGLRDDLDAAGFLPEEVDDAFAWLRGTDVQRQQLVAAPGDGALRLYSEIEGERLSSACQGYLLRLQQHGILNGATREIVIDRLLALADEDGEPIEVEQLKWVVMMVLSNQADPTAYAHMEALLLAEDDDLAH
ncbi:hypothetical protein PC39_00780 [Salinisphaera sp. PC39]|uniref:DUF494 family protein n=1 Tax=Salinisphaera sp. PC39 TaxID=1304156 RepID=UPI003341805E